MNHCILNVLNPVAAVMTNDLNCFHMSKQTRGGVGDVVSFSYFFYGIYTYLVVLN